MLLLCRCGKERLQAGRACKQLTPALQGVGIVLFYFHINHTAKLHEEELKARSTMQGCIVLNSAAFPAVR